MGDEGSGVQRSGFFIIPSGYGIPVAESIFTPEMFDDETRSIMDMVREFAAEQLADGVIRTIDAKTDHFETSLGLLKQAAELGLTGVDIPEEYGGIGLGFLKAMAISEILGVGGSWAVSWAAHVGIGTHPLLYFGSDEQRQKYLPKLASGEMIAAFAATEPGAGSDLFSLKTRAVLDGDEYVLNGEKQFITNGDFANIFTVVAAVDGDPRKTACFLVERAFGGVSVGKEEEKLGIKGSSTCPVLFDNVRVPKENLIGEVGDGLKIMLNALNLGRQKLAHMCVGPSKRAITGVVQYTLNRSQFGSAIAKFGMSQEKFAEMIARTWMVESASYRTSANIDALIEAADMNDFKAVASALREFTVEAALLKVAGSELLFDVADHCVQLMGGYGYSTEYPAERYLRDSRINRIFEGTNEINRITAAGTLLDMAAKNKLPLMEVIMKMTAELDELTFDEPVTEFPALQEKLVNNMKKMFLFAGGLVYQELGHNKKELMDSQEILRRLADMLMLVYVSESGLLRAKQVGGEIPAAIAAVYIQNAFMRVEAMTKEVLSALGEGDMLKSYLGRLKRLAKMEMVDTIALGRTIVAPLLEKGEYYL